MKARTKKILNFALIFGTLLIVLLVGFNGQEMSGAVDALRSIGPGWIVFCLLAFGAYLGLDAVSLHYFLRRQGYRVRYSYILFVSIMGLYYSNITPGATGGQPMQVYYLNKRKVPIGIGSSALVVKFFCFHFMLALVGTVLWIGYGPFIHQQVGSSMWILIIGYTYNCVAVTAVMLMAVCRRPVWLLIRLFIRLGTRLRLCKTPEASLTKWEDVLENFHGSVMLILRRPKDLLMQLLFSGLQLLSLMTVITLVYHAFHLTGATYGQLTALSVMQYLSAAYTPLPGASGAQEGVFALYFAQIFPDGIRLMALLLWRFFTYYLSLMIGAFCSVWYGFRAGGKDRLEQAKP